MSVPTKDDVEFTQSHEGLHQVHVLKGDHGTNLILYFPVAACRCEITMEFFSRKPPFDLKLVVSAGTGLSNGGIGKIGAHEGRFMVAAIAQEFFDDDGNAV